MLFTFVSDNDAGIQRISLTVCEPRADDKLVCTHEMKLAAGVHLLSIDNQIIVM